MTGPRSSLGNIICQERALVHRYIRMTSTWKSFYQKSDKSENLEWLSGVAGNIKNEPANSLEGLDHAPALLQLVTLSS